MFEDKMYSTLNLKYCKGMVARYVCREPRSFKDHVSVDSVCVTDSEEVTAIPLPPELQGSAPSVNGPLMTSSQSMFSVSCQGISRNMYLTVRKLCVISRNIATFCGKCEEKYGTCR